MNSLPKTGRTITHFLLPDCSGSPTRPPKSELITVHRPKPRFWLSYKRFLIIQIRLKLYWEIQIWIRNTFMILCLNTICLTNLILCISWCGLVPPGQKIKINYSQAIDTNFNRIFTPENNGKEDQLNAFLSFGTNLSPLKTKFSISNNANISQGQLRLNNGTKRLYLFLQ